MTRGGLRAERRFCWDTDRKCARSSGDVWSEWLFFLISSLVTCFLIDLIFLYHFGIKFASGPTSKKCQTVSIHNNKTPHYLCYTAYIVFPNYFFYVSYVRLKLVSDQWIAAWKIAIWCTNFDEFTVTVPLTQTALNVFDIKCIKSTIKTVYLHVYVHFSYFLSLWCIWKMFFWKLSSHLVWFTGATLKQDFVF